MSHVKDAAYLVLSILRTRYNNKAQALDLLQGCGHLSAKQTVATERDIYLYIYKCTYVCVCMYRVYIPLFLLPSLPFSLFRHTVTFASPAWNPGLQYNKEVTPNQRQTVAIIAGYNNFYCEASTSSAMGSR